METPRTGDAMQRQGAMPEAEMQRFDGIQRRLALALFAQSTEMTNEETAELLDQHDRNSDRIKNTAMISWIEEPAPGQPSLAHLFRTYWEASPENHREVEELDIENQAARLAFIEKLREFALRSGITSPHSQEV